MARGREESIWLASSKIREQLLTTFNIRHRQRQQTPNNNNEGHCNPPIPTHKHAASTEKRYK
ncbi:hypothetical protein N9140_00875 [bacterium]|nr:hypothetical protein [bacterium]